MTKRDAYQGTCAFCGITGHVTDDHIPPQSLFPSSKPSELLFVPGCSTCNQGWTKDDEFFKTVVTLSEHSDNSSNANAARASSLRALNRPNAKGFSKMLLSKTFHANVFTPGGVFVERRMGINVDKERIDRVVSKIVRGLFYKYSGRLLGMDYDVSVDTNETLERADPETFRDMQEQLIDPLSACQEFSAASGDFKFRYNIPTSTINASVWALVFYSRLPFLCVTGPKDYIPK